MKNLASDLIANLQHIHLLWQVGLLALCFAGAWQMLRLYQLRVMRMTSVDGTLSLGVGSVQRLIFPLSALLLVLAGRAILGQWQPVNVLNIVVPLLFSFALIRITFYMLRHTFAPGGQLRVWERFISWTVWAGLAIYITGLWPDVAGFLDSLDMTIGKQRISLLLVLQGVLLVLITLLLALWFGRFLETRLMRTTSLDISLRVMFSKLAQALLILAAIIIVLPAVGIDLTVLSIFGGMLGVGIGFGLQKIASNYISGFIILMDRSVSIGDLVTIDQHTGQLTKMTARYVVVRSLSGLEAIIPNETIVASTVVNHSYTDSRVRVRLPVQISYQSDLDAAMKIMVDVAKKHKRVIPDPEPKALILQFGESGIDLELGVWVDDPQEGWWSLRSELYLEIWHEFKRHHIEIPFPQREVRILGGATTPAGIP